MDTWEDFLRQHVGAREELQLIEAPAWRGLQLGSVDPNGQTWIYFIFPLDTTLGQVVCVTDACSACGINELAFGLSLSEKNMAWLAKDLNAIISDGWTEEHYYLSGSHPFKRVPYIGNVRQTIYYERLGFPDLLTFGLVSKFARLEHIEVPPVIPRE